MTRWQRLIQWAHTFTICGLLVVNWYQYKINREFIKGRDLQIKMNENILKTLAAFQMQLHNIDAKHERLSSGVGDIDKLIPMNAGKPKPLIPQQEWNRNRSTDKMDKVGDKIILSDGSEGIVIGVGEGHNDGKTRSWNSVVIPTNGQKHFSKAAQ
jgi:hypothetical protein